MQISFGLPIGMLSPFHRRATVFIAALLFCGCNSAYAQNYGVSNQGWDQKLYYSPQVFTPASPLEAASREYTGVPIAGWMVYANALTGVVYDDNVFQTNKFPTEDWGVRLRPSLELVRNNGMHNTTIYGFADARFYGEEDDANVVNASGGVRHVWEAQRDLVVKVNANISRMTDINNAGFIDTPSGPQTIVDPLEYNEYTGSASFLKSYGPVFFGLGTVISRTTYDDVTDSLGQTIEQSQRDQTVYTFSGRAGIWVSPVFYTFVEPSQNWREFRESDFNSQGQRIVAGIGTDRVSLFRGEIYGGYQRQDYDSDIKTVDGSVFGGRLYWFPTRDLMLTLESDRTLGDSTLEAPGNENGSPVESTSVLTRADYILSDIWALSARGGYTFTDYKETGRQDDQWIGGTTVSYFVWRNLATTFEWQHVTVDSNVESVSFDRNVYTLGATYKY